MKILFLTETFYPFNFGGSERSVYYLGRQLTEKGHKVYILTPNFGDKSEEIYFGLNVVRFPFIKFAKNLSDLPSPIFFLNPIWFITTIYYSLRLILKNDIDVIHIHGKYFIPPLRFVGYILHKEVLITVRDYQIICNYGFCLYEKDKSCGLIEYFKNDFIYYLNNYIEKKSIYNILTNVVYAVWGRITTKLLYYFARGSRIVVISKKQKKIFKENKFRHIEVIYNSIDFLDQKDNFRRIKEILYIGRLTPGKGINLLRSILPELLEKFPKFRFTFVGEGFLKRKLVELSRKQNRISILGRLDQSKVFRKIRNSYLVVVPSIWPEPFGRVALESIANKTPAVVTNRGGLPEIIENGKWGYVVKAEKTALMEGIIKSIVNNQKLTKNIKDDYKKIQYKFSSDISKKYINIYKKILK